MRDLKNKLTSSKNTKNIKNRRGKSFGYQVLGFGAGGAAEVLSVEYLVIAGGGGANPSIYSGLAAGAGGFRTSVASATSGGGASAEPPFEAEYATPYTVTVGAGGPSQSTIGLSYTQNSASGKGVSSVFATVTSIGGGAGTYFQADKDVDMNDGGSGGSGPDLGPPNPPSTTGQGTTGQGFNGGFNVVSSQGGGGGAGQVGLNGAYVPGGPFGAGPGGAGIQSAINGSATYYAGGGGGGLWNYGSPGPAQGGGLGGTGGGGRGASALTNAPTGTTATAGSANTGGGGGGSSGAPVAPFMGKAGGSGLVVVRFDDTVPDASATNGSKTTTPGYKVYTFTQSGSIVFNK